MNTLMNQESYEPIPISEIIKQCQTGKESAFEELVNRYQQSAFFIALNIVNNKETAKDISQEAFIKIYYSIKRFDTRQEFYPWLYRIVINLSIDYLRKHKNVPRPLASEIIETQPSRAASADALADVEEKRQRVRNMLAKLPDKYRVVLTLCAIEGLSSEEAAQVLKSNPGTVRWQAHKARQLFRKIWGKYDEV